MGYFILFVVVFVAVVLVKGKADKKKRGNNGGFVEVITKNNDGTFTKQMIKNNDVFSINTEEVPAELVGVEEQPEHFPKIAELNRKMEEKTAWLEADTKRMQAERARRKAAKEAEKQAKLEFKNRNK